MMRTTLSDSRLKPTKNNLESSAQEKLSRIHNHILNLSKLPILQTTTVHVQLDTSLLKLSPTL